MVARGSPRQFLHAAQSTRPRLIRLSPVPLTDTYQSYDLDGAGGNNDTSGSALVVQAVIPGVAQDDAWELSRRIDGTAALLTEADATTADLKGRVKYADADPTTVYIYVADK